MPFEKRREKIYNMEGLSPGWRDVLGRYGIAPATIAVMFFVRALLIPLIGDDSPFLYYVPAVLLSAAFAGLGPGLLATALGLALGLRGAWDGSLPVSNIANAVF